MNLLKNYFLDYIKDNYLLLIIIIIIIFNFIFLVTNYKKDIYLPTNNETIAINEMETEEKVIRNKIYVDIKGYVKNPGVYELEENAIVNDAIILAGGLKNGSTSLLNLSKKLKDGMVIYVASKNEINKLKKEKILETNEKEKISENIIYNNDVKVTTDESIGYIDSNETKLDDNSIKQDNDREDNILNEENNSNKVNINKASLNDLLKITGIGESKAKSIISYREENGLFKSIEDIKNVTGIGDALFEKIKEYIEV